MKSAAAASWPFRPRRSASPPEASKPGEPKAKIDVLGATASEADRAALTAAVARGDWMDLNLVVEGRLLRHYVNGVQTAEIVDDDDAHRAASGVLALQVHAGEPMMVQFKEIRLKASAKARSRDVSEAATRRR